MSDKKIQCYLLPATPMPLLLPVDCIAAVVANPAISKPSNAPVNWMCGSFNWENQLVQVMYYPALHEPSLDVADSADPHLVVLNPIPGAARKVYTSLVCDGEIEEIEIDGSAVFEEVPEGLDKRYIEAIVMLDEVKYLVPKLDALGVAFSYF